MIDASKIVQLTGPLAGKTITLGSQGFRFSEGKLTLLGPDETTDHLASFLWKNWQAVEVRDTWPAVQRLDVRYARITSYNVCYTKLLR